MGRRARERARAAPTTGRAAKTADRRETTTRGKTAPRRDATERTGGLDPVRRTLVAYLAAAVVLAVATLAGILVLGGTLGPFITLAVVVLGAGLSHRSAAGRLAGARLTDEDRMMQTMAGGMLVLCVILAAAGAVVATLA